MISVCLASYNGQSYIKNQILSVLSQLSKDDELLISDDSSQDGTISEIKSIQDDRIKLISISRRLGVVGNFGLVLSKASGEYIFLCDQDDVWLPNKVAECINALKTNLLVVTDCSIVDQNLNEISPSFFEVRGSCSGILKNIWKNSYLGCCMAFRKELLRYALPFPNKIPMHDMWLGLIAEVYGSVDFIPQKLVLYRRHAQVVSPTAKKSTYSFYEQLRFRALLIYSFIGRVVFLKVGFLKE